MTTNSEISLPQYSEAQIGNCIFCVISHYSDTDESLEDKIRQLLKEYISANKI